MTVTPNAPSSSSGQADTGADTGPAIGPAVGLAVGLAQIDRVRRLALALGGASEKLSHGEPTFFVAKRVFVMVANNHHSDGHTAIWIPVPPGAQAEMIAEAPEIFFKPPYVGVKGWVGVELPQIADDALAQLIRQAWQMTAPRALLRPRR